MSNLSTTTMRSNFKRADNYFKKYLMADSLVSKIIFVIVVIILFFLLLRLIILTMGYLFSPKKSPYIIKGLHEGSKRVIKQQNPSSKRSMPLYRSKNEESGIEFSYSLWLNLQYRRNENYCSHIFNKGSNKRMDSDGIYYPNNCPGLYFDARSSTEGQNNNNLVVVMNTYEKQEEKIIIENIPMDKWICVVIRVSNNIVDVYINGVITKRHILSGVPKQNYEDLTVCGGKNSGFDGQLSNLRYYDYSLGAIEINSISLYGPNLKVDKTKNISSPPYLATDWYFDNN